MGYGQIATEMPDDVPDEKPLKMPETVAMPIDSVDLGPNMRHWTISEFTGKITLVEPDTFLTDYFNRTNVEGFGTSISYLGNLGSPMESRVFSERAHRLHRADFIFSDLFYAYEKTPDAFQFINTKIPTSVLSYQTAGGKLVDEERFQGFLATNLGKNLNIGVDIDYIYARGFYASQAAKRLDWVLFGNYISDRHQLHGFYNPSDITNAENGGIESDDWILHPDNMDRTLRSSQEIPTNLSDTWNNQKGKRAFINYRYNLGKNVGAEGLAPEKFVPIATAFYTFDYKSKNRRFYTDNPNGLAHDSTDYYFDHKHAYTGTLGSVNDSVSYWMMHNTVGLALCEGFADWAKWDLTAFITHEAAGYNLMNATALGSETSEHSIFIGGELAKNRGDILRYRATGQIATWGDSFGDWELSGEIESRIPVFGDTASITGYASLINKAPSFYETKYHSNYFWWDNEDFESVKSQRFGGNLTIPHTNTKFGIEVENLKNYIYFDEMGYPKQHRDNIQVLTARLNQNFTLGRLHWDSQLVYQKVNKEAEEILPLPDFAAYSSLYVQFKIAKVLTVQLGANAHYWTAYYAPSYEPAIQQFRLQKADKEGNKVKVGNYPLINGFVNCHLKQTRFFVEWFNLGTQLLTNPPNYFSLPHYPVNPSVIKMGVSVNFIN
ncbi:hypothetical protein AGMMS49525_17040 [Bacteroidia bacterium]|nr:hypothetical protein AGMMS49525_17040 [Bacteroidia bacterium]